MGSFAPDTAVTPSAAPGRFDATIDADWWVVAGPNGGYLAAIVTRAIDARFDTAARPLRSLTLHYLSAPVAGPASLLVEPLREGGSVTFARVTLSQRDTPAVIAQAVLAAPRGQGRVPELHAVAPPAPPPEEVAPFDPPGGGEVPPFARRFEYRPVFGEPDRALVGGWLRLREDHPLDAALVAALTDSWFPALFALTGPTVVVPTLDLTVHLRASLPLPAGWVLARFKTREIGAGLLEEDGELYSVDGALLAQSRQLATAR